MKIGNVVATGKIDLPEDFNLVSSVDDIIVGLPTLIVGYEYVNKNYPDFDITNISLGDGYYWTFKRTEKRDRFEEDVSWFVSKVYRDMTDKIYYVFVDPIQYKKKTLIKIIKKIFSLKEPISYLNGNMVYIYSEDSIFGIDLHLLNYMGISSDKIKSVILRISSVFLDDVNILMEYRKNLLAVNNKIRYLPFLYALRNGKNNTISFIHIPRET